MMSSMVLSWTGMLYHTTQLVVFFHCPFFSHPAQYPSSDNYSNTSLPFWHQAHHDPFVWTPELNHWFLPQQCFRSCRCQRYETPNSPRHWIWWWMNHNVGWFEIDPNNDNKCFNSDNKIHFKNSNNPFVLFALTDINFTWFSLFQKLLFFVISKSLY